MSKQTADALRETLFSPNVVDSNFEPANIVDAVAMLANGAGRIAQSITPSVPGNRDASGGHVESLTEAVMGMTGGLHRIAEAIESLAESVREISPPGGVAHPQGD